MVLNTISKRYGKMLRRVGCGFLGSVGVVLVLAWLFPSLWFCETIAYSSFNKLSPQVFVSPYLNPKSYLLVNKVIQRSEDRVAKFFGTKVSTPKIIVCATQDEYVKYCNGYEGAGCSVASPWGSTFIVLSFDGLNVDVLSHEMSHAELVTKLGWWKTYWSIPQWFNEGLALMLDRRFVKAKSSAARYEGYYDQWLSLAAKYEKPPKLEDMASMRGFFKRQENGVMYAYMTAGMEVSYWLSMMNPDGLSCFFDAMNQGMSFQQAYSHVEYVCSSAEKMDLKVNPIRLKKVD